jgi:DNA-binding Lrp family transcriptional regulator
LCIATVAQRCVVPSISGGLMDDIDTKVLRCLVRDARATYAEIGQEVNLSAPAVKRRVDRLRSSGVIRGFTAVVDPAIVGWGTEAYVEVYCAAKVSPHRLREQFLTVPEVLSACTVSGGADAVLHLAASDVQHLERALGAIRDGGNINQTRSSIVLSRLFDRPRPPMGV